MRRERRERSKVDSNQTKIVEALRKIPGVDVSVGHDDIFVGYRGINYWFEIKSQDEISKKTKKPYSSSITPVQTKLLKSWPGQYAIVWTLEQILVVINLEHYVGRIKWQMKK